MQMDGKLFFYTGVKIFCGGIFLEWNLPRVEFFEGGIFREEFSESNFRG